MRIQNEELTLDGTDMSANITSEPIWLAHIVNASIQAVYTGSPSGDLIVEASNDFGAKTNDVSNANITNWTAVATESLSGSGSTMFNLQDTGYRWIRLRYTAGGSGTLSARYNVKGI